MGGACVIPGFVDPHTHLCFAKRREDEFKMRLDGLPYLEILKRGGGILSSVNAVKSVTEEELFFATKKLALSALAKGTTTIEIKSGYGLDLELELKMLSVISRISRETPLDVVPTFMGAHAVPVEYKERPDDFVDLIINEMLPKVREQGIAEFCDIFCEEGVFSVAQSRKILNAAREMGFGLKIHADEVHDLGGAGLAAELGVRSAEHLLAAAEENLRAMGRAGSIAVLLPATAYSLKKPYAKGREMIDWEVPVALATDCNPGSCFCESVPFIFGLGVMNMDMTVEEALSAATLNAAYAINRQHKVGSLEPGKQADFLVLDGETPTTLAYHVGSTSVLEVHKLAERVA
jgi:imidazolonepropionase